ncbi:prominin-2 isoform X2 [Latimeria chalumnae]|uniref:prominin-2 isoform X2 n=1 Tax=Latimeria chalumnae TaxID=7897 RepID=UPI00313C6199
MVPHACSNSLSLPLAVLLLCGVHVAAKTCRSILGEPSRFHNISEPDYKPDPSTDVGNVKTLYTMVHIFLNVVQPNPFPSEIVTSLMESFSGSGIDYNRVIKYEIGFLVCAAIGVIFIVFMPLVGCCFSCCRCCGRCGGRMFQEQTKSTSCKRMALVSSLFIITTIILAGNICAFVSNDKTTKAIQDSSALLNDAVANLKSFISVVPEQINTVTDESSVPIEEVTRNLDGIGEVLGRSILDQLGTDVYPVLGNISELAQGINRTRDDMLTLNEISRRLQDNQKILEKNLTDIQTSLTATINSNSCNGCGSMKTRINGLVPDANYGVIPDYDEDIKKLNGLAKNDLLSLVQEGNQTLNDIPVKVQNMTKDTVVEVKKQLQSIRNQIEKLTSEIPITDSLSQINQQLDSVTTTVEEYLPDAQMINRYRWIAAAVLCCFILLIVVCNYLGLVMGSLGHKSNVDPTKRGCLSNSGGNFFMAGTGFSFIFSWLLMILVCLTFVVGGNIYSLVCKSWENQELSKFLDTSGNFNLSGMLGLKDTTLKISDIYNKCSQNDPLWTTLHLGEVVNLDEYLNLSQYTGDIEAEFDKLNIDLSGITLLSPEGKEMLKNFSNSGIDNLNLTVPSQQVEKNFTKTDLQVLANELDQLANTQNSAVKASLRNDASRLRHLHAWAQTTLQPDVEILSRSIQFPQKFAPQIPKRVDETLKEIEKVQNLLNTSASQIAKNESEAFLNCQLNYFQLYVDWAKKTLTEDIGRCKPAANSIDAAYVISCVYFVDSLNAFWFSLGWCTIFLIPSIILSVKLAKFYRRMKCADVYEDGQDYIRMTDAPHFNIPRANLKP